MNVTTFKIKKSVQKFLNQQLIMGDEAFIKAIFKWGSSEIQSH